MASPESFDGGFNFCRIIFSQSPDGDGANWSVDYPRADINLSIRLSELTRTRISRDAATGEPNHVLVRLTDDLMFQCPFIMMTEVGAAYFSPEEAARLREYLLKGGFLWADDFWGEYAWQIWAREIGKALPPSEYPSSTCRSRIRCSGPSSWFRSFPRFRRLAGGTAAAAAPPNVPTARCRTRVRSSTRRAT